MKKLFTNDSFFHAILILSVIGIFWTSISALISGQGESMVCIIFMIIAMCEICLYVSYNRHCKNVMKGMMGAILMAMLLAQLSGTADVASDKIFMSISVIFSFGLMFNHFVINSDHLSSPWKIRINQIAAFVLVINEIAWDLTYIASGASSGEVVSLVFSAIGYCGLILFIVCVESRLDAYRKDREAAGWTEEKGYPEGYVHEFEKEPKE